MWAPNGLPLISLEIFLQMETALLSLFIIAALLLATNMGVSVIDCHLQTLRVFLTVYKVWSLTLISFGNMTISEVVNYIVLVVYVLPPFVNRMDFMPKF